VNLSLLLHPDRGFVIAENLETAARLPRFMSRFRASVRACLSRDPHDEKISGYGNRPVENPTSGVDEATPAVTGCSQRWPVQGPPVIFVAREHHVH
jgi:hypothetical protein